ncbi:LppA family lipoprotein [Actinokineospora sp.]|uniref:LppA family lipoprotein n=1 Tax=Actinokineospora sp. TaxID=1872133 RepID=UPI003D6A069E
MDTSSADRAAQYNEMRARPDIEQITQRYEDLRTAIRDRLTQGIGLPSMVPVRKGGASGCRDFPAVEQALKESRGLPGYYTEANIPDDKWPDAVRIVTEIASPYGFTTVVTVVDQPGDHEISLSDEYGGELIFGTKLATILSARTGCHLFPEGQRLGSTSPTPTTAPPPSTT